MRKKCRQANCPEETLKEANWEVVEYQILLQQSQELHQNFENALASLADITQESLYLAIKMVKPGVRLGDIGAAIQKYAEGFSYSIVREYCGHGIGAEFHEEPQVMHYGKAGTGEVLKAGMCLTIEPMVNAGKRQCKLLKDNWTVVTKDRSLSAQWEHTLLVTENGVEILTLRSDDTIDRIIEH